MVLRSTKEAWPYINWRNIHDISFDLISIIFHELAKSSFGVVRLSCVDHRIQMSQLIMRPRKNRCIILDLIWSSDNVGDHNLNLQCLRITACTADIISLYQIEFPSSCLHFYTRRIDHSRIFPTQWNKASAIYFCIYTASMAIFWNKKIIQRGSISTLSWPVAIYKMQAQISMLPFSQRHIESLPLTCRDLEKMCSPLCGRYF